MDTNQESPEPGCGDASCIFACIRPRGGMRTNGGCRCFEHLRLNTMIQSAMDPTQLWPYNNWDNVEHVRRSTMKLRAMYLDLKKIVDNK